MADESSQNDNIKTKEVPKAKRTFWSDIWRKVIALLLAIATCVLVMMKSAKTVTIEGVPVIIQYDRNKYFLPQNRFSINLQVSSWLDIPIRPDDFELVYEMPSNIQSKFTWDAGCDDKIVRRKPRFVKIESFSPQVLKVSGDVMETRNVRVRVNYTLPPSDRQVPQFKVEPERVKVRGPSYDVRREVEIWTESIDLVAGRKESYIEQKNLVSPLNSRISLVDTQSVKVTVIYGTPGEDRTYWDVPVLVLNDVFPRVDIRDKEPLVVDMVVKGGENLPGNQKLHPYLDLSRIDFKEAEKNLYVEIELLEKLPEGVTVEFQPATTISLHLFRVDSLAAPPRAEPVSEPEPTQPPAPPAK
ncbi:MAG: hypothetical protein IJJ26_07075 [Victivallales bacterium]|nr:hypothetical protein [Victivallales bacterium]